MGDFNGDGCEDALVATGSGGELLLGAPDGTFLGAAAPSLGAPFQWRPVAGDVNGDGKLDLTTLAEGRIAILLGRGDATFGAAPETDMAPYTATGVELADLDGDRHLDLIAEDGNASVLAIRHGVGDGTFSAPVFFQPTRYFGLPGAGVEARGADVLLRADGMAWLSTSCR